MLLDTAYSDFSTRNLGLIAHMAYEWCQRLGDMRLLTWDGVDFDNKTVYIEQSKRRAEVHLPISDDLCDMLTQQEQDFGFKSMLHHVLAQLVNTSPTHCIISLYGRKLMQAAGLL